MVSARIYLEGGGDSKDGKSRCREGFRKLLEKCGLGGRMPRLVACGSRGSAYDAFKNSHRKVSGTDYVALLIDSEDPLQDMDKTWDHLKRRDSWERPQGAQDDQVLFMTTCMETWIVADLNALDAHFGQRFQPNALPPLHNVESRARGDVQMGLERATRDTAGPYKKGPKSYEVLSKIDPDTIEPHLPSFRRTRKLLGEKLGSR